MIKKEIFIWIKEGVKTIDVRKGKSRQGDSACFLSGRNKLKLSIVKKETGRLNEIIRTDTYKSIIPSANTCQDALAYLQTIYGDIDGVFTAYYLTPG